MKKALSLAVVVIAVAASAASAGTYLSAVTTTDGVKAGSGLDATVRMWAEGDKARVEVAESRSAVLRPGLFLLTLDGGRTVFLVDPSEKTFAKWDGAAAPGATAAEASARRRVVVTYSEPKVEKLAESDGGQVAGVPTTHLRFRITFSATTKEMGVQQTSTTLVEDDLWVAPRPADAALGIWLAKGPRKTGDEKLDALLAAQQPKFDGFPLKRVTVTTTTDDAGRKSVVTTTTTVSELIVGEMPAGTFAMGTGYREIPPAPPAAKPADQPQATADEAAPEQDRYPFDRMLDQPAAGEQAGQPQAGQPAAQPQGQPAVAPQPGQPAAQPATPGEPAQPEPEPEPEQPEYPFERMLDSPRK
jgi:hypothetical protein